MHHPGVLALIEDAVTSKRGVFVHGRDQLYVSGLKKPSDALVVCRQVQLGLQGFRGRHGTGPVAVSIAIDASRGAGNGASGDANGDNGPASPSEPGSDEGSASNSSPSRTSAHRALEPSHDLVTLLKLSKPAQILLTHDLCQQMTGIKGLPLKSFPGRFGVYEYLWTAEDKLELLQSEPQLTLTALPAALPVAPASKPAPHKDNEATVAGRATLDRPQSSDGMVQQPSTPFQWSWLPPPLTPRILAFAAVGLGALGAALAVGIHLSRRHVSGVAPAAIAAPASNPQPVSPALIPPRAEEQPEAGPVAIPAAKPRRGSTSGRTAARQAANKSAPAEDTSAPVPAPPPGCAQTIQAGRLVTLGEQFRGRGDYTNAVRVFREVLACDPSNATAREGLDKALRGQEQR